MNYRSFICGLAACCALSMSVYSTDNQLYESSEQATSKAPMPMPPENKSAKATVPHTEVIACLDDIVIIKSHSPAAFCTIHTTYSYLEAFSKKTGEKLWTVRDVGYILSFIVADSETIIYRNYDNLTAVRIQTGEVLWKTKTEGCYSIYFGS